MLTIPLLLFVAVAGCSDDEEPCGPTNCPGCCSPETGVCLGGRENIACGNAGQPCFPCTTGTTCQPAVAPTPAATAQPAAGGTGVIPSGGSCKFTTTNPTNCSPGCKALDGTCKGGNENNYCGTGGAACRPCTDGTICQAGQCTAVCNYNTCKEGCCEGNSCIKELTDLQCGKDGLKCKKCESPKTCDVDVGDCAETTPSGCIDCKGCCQNDKCFDGDSPGACGKGGGSCDICDVNTEQCLEGDCKPKPTCDLTNCTDGCCTSAKECVHFGQQDLTKCGKTAQPCSPCTDAIECTLGICVKDQPCFSYCTQGCCTLAGQCIGFGDQDTDSCGKDADLCAPCGDDLSCLAGTCQPDPVWRIKVDSLVLTETDANGDPWDSWPQNPPPDPYVLMAVGTASGTTDTISNATTPCWACDPTYDGTVLDAAQSQLTNNSLKISVHDSEPIGYTVAGTCSMMITVAMLSSGSHVLSQCGLNVSDIQLKFIKQ